MTSPLRMRAEAIDRLTSHVFDLLVVGGGITGTGTALDAASRGLRVALIERDDLAAGTSSRSSKLIHGGLRYLEQRRFGLVREALRERAIIRRIAPHLVRLSPFLVPVHGSWLNLAYYGAGLALYGGLGAGREVGPPKYLTPAASCRRHPSIRGSRLRGGLLYHDGIVDDARFVVTVARTAVGAGATLVTRMRAVDVTRARGRVEGALAVDLLSGDVCRIRATAVLDATGATGGSGGPFGLGGPTMVMPSRGTHLVVLRSRIPGTTGLTVRVPGRVVFLVPWLDRWVIGTTDHPQTGAADRPTASKVEVDELLEAINSTLDVGLTQADIIATFAGIRPLVAAKAASTVTASREHEIQELMPGLFTVRGGKFTTYRLMAQQIVDRIVGRGGATGVGRSPTASLRLVGAFGPQSGHDAGRRVESLATTFNLDRQVVERVVDRYGCEAAEVLAFGRERDLLKPLHPEVPYLEVDVAWAVERELALTVDDILARRLRLALEVADHGASVATRAARIAASSLGWSDEVVTRAAAGYRDDALREYGVPA